MGKRQEHKAVRKQEGNFFFFNLIYKVVTLEFDIKISLEKLEASELNYEEAPYKLNVSFQSYWHQAVTENR